ncbi:hypothetical protein [Paenibacillus sinopodophylli]|uniref:hypothetical protein n=1 Tax=Paenibacillus sinopodophylli TaxID=1837342 RepID=UPI00110CBB87|nr:hypothetical protein [Paenibacillus sinopodophylli]
MTRPQLVLDIGGVLATNLTPSLWQLLAAETTLPASELYALYKQEISEQLWTGHVSEEQFWDWVITYTPLLSREQAYATLSQCLQPLPAMALIPEWHTLADIHLLSNHIAAWVDPIISMIKPYLQSVTISNQIGLKKPHPDVFESVMGLLPPECSILFVDDHPRNLKQAASHGWRTLLADEEGDWTKQVIPQLKHMCKT